MARRERGRAAYRCCRRAGRCWPSPGRSGHRGPRPPARRRHETDERRDQQEHRAHDNDRLVSGDRGGARSDCRAIPTLIGMCPSAPLRQIVDRNVVLVHGVQAVIRRDGETAGLTEDELRVEVADEPSDCAPIVIENPHSVRRLITHQDKPSRRSGELAGVADQPRGALASPAFVDPHEAIARCNEHLATAEGHTARTIDADHTRLISIAPERVGLPRWRELTHPICAGVGDVNAAGPVDCDAACSMISERQRAN